MSGPVVMRVTYLVSGAPGVEVKEIARRICLEQTVEVTEELIRDPWIEDHLVGEVLDVRVHGSGSHLVTVGYRGELFPGHAAQFLNVLYGNISLEPGVSVVGLELDPGVAPGPVHGVQGLRDLLAVPRGPMLATALKPLGLPVQELARLCRDLALGGIDVIKDDHGLGDHPFCRFEERVAACVDAVLEAREETGHHTMYFPSLNLPADRLLDAAQWAAERGADGFLVAPMLVGPDFLRVLADRVGLPIMAHPGLAGPFFTDQRGHRGGIAAEVFLGRLLPAMGADMVIFPSFGGRFDVTEDLCRGIAETLLRAQPDRKPALPVPAGGLDLGRMDQVARVYGADVMFLVGSSLLAGPGSPTDRVKRLADTLRWQL